MSAGGRFATPLTGESRGEAAGLGVGQDRAAGDDADLPGADDLGFDDGARARVEHADAVAGAAGFHGLAHGGDARPAACSRMVTRAPFDDGRWAGEFGECEWLAGQGGVADRQADRLGGCVHHLAAGEGGADAGDLQVVGLR